MPKIDLLSAPKRVGAGYPEPYRSRVGEIERLQLGEAAGLDQFGVNLTTLLPGCVSSVRHWHENEDELVFVVSGEVVLVEDGGETVLGPGDAAGFKAGVPDGHHLVNRSDRPASFLEIGHRAQTEVGHYPDDDLAFQKHADGTRSFTRKDGSRFD